MIRVEQSTSPCQSQSVTGFFCRRTFDVSGLQSALVISRSCITAASMADSWQSSNAAAACQPEHGYLAAAATSGSPSVAESARGVRGDARACVAADPWPLPGTCDR